MSRDPLTAQDAQVDGNAPATSTQTETYGLRPDLHAEIMRMSPADSDLLANMLSLYPSFMGAILMVAASHMGNAAVQRAMQLVKQRQATRGREGSLSQDEMHEMTREPSDALPIKSHELSSFIGDESNMPAAVEAAPAKPPVQAEPAWVAGARAYNAAHPDLVAEFNDLTDDMCTDDDDGKLDPQAVARWQSHHGIPADGKVGPQTVAAAKAAKAKNHAPEPAPAAGPA
jgi:murein L,D-transpeptidase YcbB/YkuD